MRRRWRRWPAGSSATAGSGKRASTAWTPTCPKFRRETPMQSNEARSFASDEVLELTRVFEAPRELVWRLWSDPEHIARWWGPETCWLDTVEMDFREGGKWHFWMRNGTGLDHHISGEYRAIQRPERLHFTYINA